MRRILDEPSKELDDMTIAISATTEKNKGIIKILESVGIITEENIRTIKSENANKTKTN